MGRITSTTAMRALQGRTIVITRAAAQAHRFVELLEAEGADVVPGEYRAEGLIARLRSELHPGDRVLLPRAAQTRDVLVQELRRAGADVVEVPVYVTRRVDRDAGRLRDALTARTVHAVTFTSSSTARNFAERA